MTVALGRPSRYAAQWATLGSQQERADGLLGRPVSADTLRLCGGIPHRLGHPHGIAQLARLASKNHAVASMLIRDLPDELGELHGVTLADVGGRADREPGGLPRRLWEHPARELLHLLRGGRTEVQSPDAAALLAELRVALEEVEIPEHYR